MQGVVGMRHYVAKYSPMMLTGEDVIQRLDQMLDEALEDVEQGRVLTLDEAWKEIDAV